MSWTELLTREMENVYGVTDKLLDLVDADKLDWKPASGENWMTTGQLLMHIATACGQPCKGFVTGDWGMPADFDPSQLKPEDMLPPAEKMPTVGSVAEAKRMLAEDKQVALAMVKQASEGDLANKPAPAPWDPHKMVLGHRMLQMVDHLSHHKGQLFYYLKLQGKPVNTKHMWGT